MNAIIYILGVFLLILVLARFKVSLTISIAIGTVSVGFLFGLNSQQIAIKILFGTIQPRTIGLAVITILILSLSSLMDLTGQMKKIVLLAKQLLRRPAFAMAALPALIGLLPMPGGALFSAPMVKSAAANSEIKGSELSAINYWYRHIWEHWWPLYPGVMLAMTLTGISFSNFAIFQMPLGLFMACTGLLLFRKTHPDLHIKAAPAPAGTKRKFLLAISSIWIIILVWIPVSYIINLFILPALSANVRPTIEKFLPLAIGLICSIIFTTIFEHAAFSKVSKIFARKSTYGMVALVVSVMVFQYMLIQVGAAEQIADELLGLRVPIVLVVAILPFIAGMVTGLAIGFVGTSFPIVLALVGTLGNETAIYPYIALAYGFGHLGQMISPIHLCYPVSNQYFQTGFADVYRRLLPTVIINFVLVGSYFAILKILSLS
ncbi:hypothetical protein ES708_10108 [subsurface metagenome]